MFDDVGAVLFDLDGTLVDSAPDLGAAADKMRVDRGLPALGVDRYRAMAGSGARGMLGVAFDLGPEHPTFSEMREEFFSNYEAGLTQSTVAFEGIQRVIEQLNAARCPWGVVTNKSARFSVPLTRSLPLFATSGVLVSGDTTPFSKPHPAPLLEAARALGVDPARCIYVGDDARDIIAGRAAGMRTVVAAYGYLGAAADIASWGADASLATPVDLLSLLPFVMPASGVK